MKGPHRLTLSETGSAPTIGIPLARSLPPGGLFFCFGDSFRGQTTFSCRSGHTLGHPKENVVCPLMPKENVVRRLIPDGMDQTATGALIAG